MFADPSFEGIEGLLALFHFLQQHVLRLSSKHPSLPHPGLPLHVHQPRLLNRPPLLQVCHNLYLITPSEQLLKLCVQDLRWRQDPPHHRLPPHHPPAQPSPRLLCWHLCQHLHGLQDHHNIYVKMV